MFIRVLQFFFGCSYFGYFHERACMINGVQCERRALHKGPHYGMRHELE
jgi:hypothetical protein